MMPRRSFIAISAAGSILSASAFASAQTPTGSAVKTGYAPVNGLKTYYEIHGVGEPLILLHGGVVGITMFGPNLDALSQKRKVIAVELQGHGRTADIDRPLSYEAMADDIATLMKYLGIERADVMGYSLGGGVALQTAIRHPASVRKLVVVSATCKRDGWYPEVLDAMAQMGPAAGEQMKQSPLYRLYPNVNWAVLFTKLGDLLRKDYDCARHRVLRPARRRPEERWIRWFWKTCKPARHFAWPHALQHQLQPRARHGRNPVPRRARAGIQVRRECSVLISSNTHSTVPDPLRTKMMEWPCRFRGVSYVVQ